MALIVRAFARGLAVTVPFFGVVAVALAQTLTITAPAPPGSGWDKTAHAMQDALTSTGLAERVQVVNMPGSGGTVGLAKFTKHARGDDKQLLVTGVFMVGALIINRSSVSLDDVTPIARLTAEAGVVVVPAASSIQNINDLVAALKKDPVKISWAGGLAGGIDHVAAALIAKAAGVDMTKLNYIPFVGTGEVAAAVVNNQVTAGISNYGELGESITAGKLRVLGITSRHRSAFIDAPTLAEQGVEVDVVNWRGVVAAPGISEEQRKVLARAVDKMVASPSWSSNLKARHWDDAYLSSDAFPAFLKQEEARVADVLKSIGFVRQP
jgi:putative tricarboxylic transport membrane protein